MLPSKLQGGLMSEYRMKASARCHQLPRFEPPRFEQPAIQPLDPASRVDLGSPAGSGFELSRVRHVIALVAGPPLSHPDLRLLAAERADEVQEFEQADRVPQPSADIECLSRKG